MQKSIYQDEVFAKFWNDRAGDEGEAYKRYILDPLMFGFIGSLSGKTILELGCGNGYLASKFIDQNPDRVILMDISSHNLEYATKKCKDPRVTFIEQDATDAWKISDESIDVIYSNMMLNEVENIQVPIIEAYRVLKKDGIFVFSVTHPAWDLYIYAREQISSSSSNKVKGLGGYFRRGFAKFIMSGKGSKGEKFEVEHYQRPVEDYFNQLVEAKFMVKHMNEPEITDELLQVAPRFEEYRNHPVGLVFYCVK